MLSYTTKLSNKVSYFKTKCIIVKLLELKNVWVEMSLKNEEDFNFRKKWVDYGGSQSVLFCDYSVGIYICNVKVTDVVDTMYFNYKYTN